VNYKKNSGIFGIASVFFLGGEGGGIVMEYDLFRFTVILFALVHSYTFTSS